MRRRSGGWLVDSPRLFAALQAYRPALACVTDRRTRLTLLCITPALTLCISTTPCYKSRNSKLLQNISVLTLNLKFKRNRTAVKEACQRLGADEVRHYKIIHGSNNHCFDNKLGGNRKTRRKVRDEVDFWITIIIICVSQERNEKK